MNRNKSAGLQENKGQSYPVGHLFNTKTKFNDVAETSWIPHTIDSRRSLPRWINQAKLLPDRWSAAFKATFDTERIPGTTIWSRISMVTTYRSQKWVGGVMELQLEHKIMTNTFFFPNISITWQHSPVSSFCAWKNLRNDLIVKCQSRKIVSVWHTCLTGTRQFNPKVHMENDK